MKIAWRVSWIWENLSNITAWGARWTDGTVGTWNWSNTLKWLLQDKAKACHNSQPAHVTTHHLCLVYYPTAVQAHHNTWQCWMVWSMCHEHQSNSRTTYDGTICFSFSRFGFEIWWSTNDWEWAAIKEPGHVEDALHVLSCTQAAVWLRGQSHSVSHNGTTFHTELLLQKYTRRAHNPVTQIGHGTQWIIYGYGTLN